MEVTKSIFFQRYNLTIADLETYLREALSRGGDYADLYFEYRINHSIVLEEQIIKSATKSVILGVGVRVISGEKTGYAYSDDLNRENVIKAARTAAFIANASSHGGKIQVPAPVDQERNLYPINVFPAENNAFARCRSGGSLLRFAHQASTGELCRRNQTRPNCHFGRQCCMGSSAIGPAERDVHR